MRYRTAVITAATLAFSGCGSVTEPSTRPPVSTPPAIPATPPAPPFVTTGSAAWTLELTSFKVQLFRCEPGAPLQYEPETLALKEIGGRVTEVSFTATFADEGGKVGQVRGSANVTGCTLGGKPGLISCK